MNFFGPSVQTNIFGGARLINIDRSDHIFQQFNPLTDVNMNTIVDQDSYLFGPQAGIWIQNRPFQRSGFTFGAGGSISFLVSENDGDVRSSVECPVCPFGDITIRANADDGISSLAVDGNVFVGYKFGENIEVKIFGSVTHLTDAPYVHIPVNPADPLRIDEDDLTSATVGAQFKIELGSRLKSLATTSVGF